LSSANVRLHKGEDEVVISALEGYAPLFEMLELKEEEVRSKAAMTLAILGKLPQWEPLLKMPRAIS
jgi:hypothetical protein